ncbi:hypothetical protein [Maridesulfovibrio sp.]|uniref:hypothetical protein n=1 Tax=Maridesulfovibrio sp. TaxID=2795000 RepID=UPI003BACB993
MNIPSIPATNIYAYLTTMGLALFLFGLFVPVEKSIDYKSQLNATMRDYKVAKFKMADMKRQEKIQKEIFNITNKNERNIFINYKKYEKNNSPEEIAKLAKEKLKKAKQTILREENKLAQIREKQTILMADVDYQYAMIENLSEATKFNQMLGHICLLVSPLFCCFIVPWWKQQKRQEQIQNIMYKQKHLKRKRSLPRCKPMHITRRKTS